MKIKVDYELCQGNGDCVEDAPEVFDTEEVPGRYPRVVVLQEHPGQELHEKVKKAVKHCPTRALSIMDD